MSRILTFSKALNEALHQEMEQDEKVFVLGEDVVDFGGLLKQAFTNADAGGKRRHAVPVPN